MVPEVVLTTDTMTLTLKLVFVSGYKSELVAGDKSQIDTVTLSAGAAIGPL